MAISTMASAAAIASIFKGTAIFSSMPRRAASASSSLPPAEKFAGSGPPRHHFGGGEGGSEAAAGVADGAGIGAGALGPALERPDVAEPGGRAAPRPDLDHVDHRQHHRMAAG